MANIHPTLQKFAAIFFMPQSHSTHNSHTNANDGTSPLPDRVMITAFNLASVR